MATSPGPSSVTAWHPPMIPPPTPIPLGALPVLHSFDSPSASAQVPRKMSIPGSHTSYAYPPATPATSATPRTQPVLVRLRPTRIRDFPHRLRHPPPLPAFMQDQEPERDHSGDDAAAAGNGDSKGKARAATTTTFASASPESHDDDHARGCAGLLGSPHSSSRPDSNPNEIRFPPESRRKETARRWNWGITPSFEVKLEDVLERKHLPPLGLKDFEEWLLFVEGHGENLYFVLWLREYTTRYNTWTASIKSARTQQANSPSDSAPFARSRPFTEHTLMHSHSQQIQFQQDQQQRRQPERPFASLGMAMERVGLGSGSAKLAEEDERAEDGAEGRENGSTPPTSVSASASAPASASGEDSPGATAADALGDTNPYRHDPSFPHSTSAPAPAPVLPSSRIPSQIELDTDSDDSFDRPRGQQQQEGQRQRLRLKREYRTPAPAHPPPNPALSLFYLRAKETFLTPNAPYELAVSSAVLAAFNTPNGGVLGGLGHGGGGGVGGGGGGAYGYPHPLGPPPPDPAVFAELAEIVEGELRASLKRLVLATYNNVGLPRAYCGTAGGFVIGLIGSVPPLASSFALGGPRWYRLLALPGMWVGLTICISAWYGVCMMIYIFGDLRQLRSFELARPAVVDPRAAYPEGAGGGVAGKGEGKGEVAARARAGSVPQVAITRPPKPLLRIVTPAQGQEGRKDAQTPTRAQGSHPGTPPPRGVAGSRLIEAVGEAGAEVEAEVGVEEAGDGREDGDGDGERGSRPAREADVTTAAYDGNEGDGDNKDGDDDGDDDEYEDEDEEGDEEYETESEPAIEISDAFYDEHPSPEGPATAPADWMPSTLTQPPQRDTAAAHNPLWPDYTFEPSDAAGPNATAAFIGPYVYDGSEFDARAAAGSVVVRDVERVAEMDAAACQPMGEFDFDGLPPPPGRKRCSGGAGEGVQGQGQGVEETRGRLVHVKKAKAKAKARDRERERERDRERETEVKHELSPSASSMSGSVKEKRWWSWWWWATVERVQTICSPENAVDALEKEQVRGEKARGKARAKAKAKRREVREGEREEVREEVREGREGRAKRALPAPPTSPRSDEITISIQDGTRHSGGGWREGLKKMYLAVPAFASPLTPILNPLVGRAQWEIVVRSGAMAFFLCCVIVGALLAVPERH